MKTIRHTATLFYYEGPQVFEARDAIGGHYIALMIEQGEMGDRYLVVGVAPEQLRQFRAGLLDLMTLMTDRTESDWYIGAADGDFKQPFVLEPQEGDLAASGLLPDPGFVLHDRPADTETVREARERNNLVLEITVEPPEAAQDHRIRVGTLIGLLGRMQTMVKHAYGASLRQLSYSARKAIDRTDAHLLDVVVPAAPGSFRIVLEAARTPNLLGQNELTRALQRVDELFENVDDPQKVLAKIKEHRGHLATAYLRLLSFLVESKSGLNYSWAEPDFPKPKRGAVTQAEAGPLVELLSTVSNLGEETITIVGALKKADVDNGTWRIATQEEDFSGETQKGGPSLAGLRLESIYQFNCIEEIEEMEGTGREKRKLYLVSHEPISNGPGPAGALPLL